MKNKVFKIIIIAFACVIVLGALVLVLSQRTYHKFEQDGYSFEFKGSFDTVRKLVIKENGEKISSLRVKYEADIFSSIEDYSAIFEDLDRDGEKDILLPTAVEADGDIVYSAFIFNEATFEAVDELQALTNPTVDKDNGDIYTKETVKEIIEEATKSSPEFYILTEKIAKHTFVDRAFITLEERAVIYYSENDYYCYSIYEYNEEYKELMYVDEKWFEAKDIEKYPLNWD